SHRRRLGTRSAGAGGDRAPEGARRTKRQRADGRRRDGCLSDAEGSCRTEQRGPRIPADTPWIRCGLAPLADGNVLVELETRTLLDELGEHGGIDSITLPQRNRLLDLEVLRRQQHH